jgi:ketosteroid isomerase-like protein
MAARRKAGSTRARTQKAVSKPKTTARKKPAKKPAAKKRATSAQTKRKAAGAKSAPAIETLARRIVRATMGGPSKIPVEDLYAEDCTSHEPAGEPAVGIQAIRGKTEVWEGMIQEQAWSPRHVFAKGNTIAIEWDAKVVTKDGRKIDFHEVAIHEVKGGKIVAERYIYDPAQLAPPPKPVEPPKPVVQAPPPGPPPVDPLDL